MVKTIERTIHFFFLILFIFGSGILRYPFDRPRLCLSIFYILILWTVYAWVFYYVMINCPPNKGPPVFFLMLIINLFVTMITIIMTIYKRKVYFSMQYLLLS